LPFSISCLRTLFSPSISSASLLGSDLCQEESPAFRVWLPSLRR
jgi:hypothetical protein